MKKIKKRSVRLLVFFLTVLMLAGVFSGCAETPTESSMGMGTTAPVSTKVPPSTPEPAKVKFVYAGFRSDAWIIKALEKYSKLNPHVTFESQIMDHDSYQQKMTICVESNTLPDIFWWNGLYLQQTWNAKPEVLADMSAYVDDEFYNSVTDAGWNTYCRDADTGAIYAFPETTQVQGWLVNEEIFSKCGLEVPETTKQLLAAIPALKEKGYIPIAFGTKEPWFSWGWEHLPSLWGYWEQADDLFTKGTLKCEDADFVNVYNYIADLYEAGAFPEYNATMTWAQAQALFSGEQAAIIMSPSDHASELLGVGTDNDISKKCRFIHAFTFEDSPYNQKKAVISVANGNGIGAGVNADPAKKEAIGAFFRWLYTDDGIVQELVSAGQMLPTTKDVSAWPIPGFLTDAIGIASSDEYEPVLSSAATFVQRWYSQSDFVQAYYKAMHEGFFCGLADGSITRAQIPERVKQGTAIIADNIAKGANVNPNP